jgi:hypothetical protein
MLQIYNSQLEVFNNYFLKKFLFKFNNKLLQSEIIHVTNFDLSHLKEIVKEANVYGIELENNIIDYYIIKTKYSTIFKIPKYEKLKWNILRNPQIDETRKIELLNELFDTTKY